MAGGDLVMPGPRDAVRGHLQRLDTRMSTTTDGTTAPTTPQGDPSGSGQGDPASDAPLGPGGEKALNAERDARKAAEKNLSALQAELDAIRDAEKSDIEKATSRAEAAEKRAAELEALSLRREVADAKGLPLAIAARLTGTTREELEADADQLAALIGQDTNPSPRPDPIQGRTRGGDTMSSRERLARSIMTPGAS